MSIDLTPHKPDLTREMLAKRIEQIDKLPTSLHAIMKPLDPEDPNSKRGGLRFTTHTFPNGKVHTFPEGVYANGEQVVPLGKKYSSANRTFVFPPGPAVYARINPEATCKFADPVQKKGRCKYTIVMQDPDNDSFDHSLFKEYVECRDEFVRVFNEGLAQHYAKECNTDGVPLTQCDPVIKQRWTEFKAKYLETAKTNNDALKQTLLKQEVKAALKKGLKEKDAAKEAKENIKEMYDELSMATDEESLRTAFYDDLIKEIGNKDSHFIDATNGIYFDAEVTIIDFDYRNNHKIFTMRQDDIEHMSSLRAMYPLDVKDEEVLEKNKKQHQCIDYYAHSIEESYSTKFPLRMNNEMTFTDSSGSPMTIPDVIKNVKWEQAVVVLTIKTRDITAKSVNGMRVMKNISMISAQIDINGKESRSYTNHNVGSAKSAYGEEANGRKRALPADAQDDQKKKRPSMEAVDHPAMEDTE